MRSKSAITEKWKKETTYQAQVSSIRTSLIHLVDALGYDDSPKHRTAFNKAFGELCKLFAKTI